MPANTPILKKVIVTSGLIAFGLTGVALFYFLNYYLIQNLIIPDICYYHSRETNFIFDMFYTLDFPGSNGHPIPTTFNLILTVITGGAFGLCTFKSLFKKNIY